MEKNIDIFIIAIDNNKISQGYKNTAITSLRFNDYNPQIFSAITPDQLPFISGLKFGKLNSNGSKRNFSETEKSTFYSHYLLWLKCIEINKPIIILEHDSILTKAIDNYNKTTTIAYRLKHEKPFRASGGGLYLKPQDALNLCIKAESEYLSLQLDGFIENTIDLNFDPCFLNYIFNNETTIIHKEKP